MIPTYPHFVLFFWRTFVSLLNFILEPVQGLYGVSMIFHCSQDSLTNSFSCTITMIYNKGGKSHARNARRVALVAPRRRYSNREKALALCLVQEKLMVLGRLQVGGGVAQTVSCGWWSRADKKMPNMRRNKRETRSGGVCTISLSRNSLTPRLSYAACYTVVKPRTERS